MLVVLGSHGQTLTSSNLPIIKISTAGADIPDEPKITATMKVIFNGAGVRNNTSDVANNYDGKIGIEIRGSSSQGFEKKQYAIELRDANGNGVGVSLLGMPEEEDWVLFGPYNDKSLMRDALAYKLGRDMGRYAPRTRFCEVILNNSYMGIYTLVEKIKRDENRLDIAKLNPDETSGDDLTGGYIIKVDKSSGNSGEGFVSSIPPPNRSGDQQIYFQYEYPKFDEIVPAQKNYIQNYVHSFESALNGPNYKDPSVGYGKYIDVGSFIDFLIVQEVSKNVDGYRLSTFMHKQKDSDGGKLAMGPLWDFNLGFGNADYCTTGSTPGFAYDFNDVCNGDYWLIPFWWDRLLTDESFRDRLGGRWAGLRNDKFQTSVIHEYIDSVATALNESKTRNFQKWNVLGQYIWPNYYVGNTYSEEVEWLKSWVTDRMIWLDDSFPEYNPTAVNEDELSVSFNSYPNPFKEEIIIQYLADKPTTVSVEIMDMLGRKVVSMNHSFDHKESHRLQFNETAIEPGVYLLRLTQQGQYVYTSKMIKR